MDTIRQYLDSMFAHLPGTPEVVRAKAELGQMMEDKYTELREEGRSENEAVGIVISEFGNLEELAEELGIRSYLNQDPEGAGQEARAIPFEEVEVFLKERTRFAYMGAFGVFFIVICAMPLLVLSGIPVEGRIDDAFMTMGIILLFLLLAGGLAMLIYSGLQSRQFAYLWKENVYFDHSTKEYIRMKYADYRNTHTILIVVGIALCVLCAVPAVLVTSLPVGSSPMDEIAGAISLFIAGIAVFLFVLAGRQKGAFGKLLKVKWAAGKQRAGQASDRSAGQRSDAPERADLYRAAVEGGEGDRLYYENPFLARFMPVYWQTVTCLYLIISFLTFAWGTTWIIWPVAGIVHAVISKSYGRHLYEV